MAIDSQVQQQASNPNTPAEKLRELADCDDATIRQLVVVNPNTPTEILWRLGKEFPECLLENPVLPLLGLENLNLVDVIPIDTLICLFKLETVPDYLKQGLIHAKVQVREAICASSLGTAPLTQQRFAIANNSNTPLDLLKSKGLPLVTLSHDD